jgi:hypothetical protein
MRSDGRTCRDDDDDDDDAEEEEEEEEEEDNGDDEGPQLEMLLGLKEDDDIQGGYICRNFKLRV